MYMTNVLNVEISMGLMVHYSYIPVESRASCVQPFDIGTYAV